MTPDRDTDAQQDPIVTEIPVYEGPIAGIVASPDGSRVVRAWFKPYVTLIWLGAIIMALAGFLSLTDRRLRVGVARRVAARPAPAE